MNSNLDFNLIIIGSGPGGYVAAIRAAQLGYKVAVIEKEEIGGTCLNVGCIPTKVLVSTAKVLTTLRGANSFGIKIDSSSINFQAIMNRKDNIVKQLRAGIKQLFKSNGIEIIKGVARFLDKNKVEVSNNNSRYIVSCSRFIIATGSIPAQIADIEINHEKIITSNDILRLHEIPSSLFIIGAGAIGIEFACIFNELGSKVKIVEMLPRILPNEDEEISKELEKFLILKGIEVNTGIKPDSGMFKDYEKVLIAVGRKPYIEGLNLENVGIILKNNRILVNNRMETNIPGIYAIGDVVGGALFAHKASAEGLVAAENACEKDSIIDYKIIPSCVYSMPEVASIGLTEAKARELGYEIAIGKFPFAANGRAITLGEVRGFVKVIADKKTDAILGVHIIGLSATELISECALAIQLECTTEEFKRIVHPHPTLSEAIFEAAHDVHKKAIELPRKQNNA